MGSELKGWAQSSMNPEQISNTIRGAGAALSGVILLLLAYFGHPTDAGSISNVVDHVAALGGQLATGLGAAWALYGLVMKGIVWFAKK